MPSDSLVDMPARDQRNLVMFKLVTLLEHSPLLVVQVHVARPVDARVVVSCLPTIIDDRTYPVMRNINRT